MSLQNNKDLVVRGTELKVDRMLAGLSTSTALQGVSITIGGVTLAAKDLEKKLDTYASVYKAARDARASLHETVAAKEAIDSEAARFAKALRATLVAALGRSNAELAKFGIAPNNGPAPLTSEQKARKAAKARATRQARHTLGAVQKKALTGASAAVPQAPAVTVVPAGPTNTTLSIPGKVSA